MSNNKPLISVLMGVRYNSDNLGPLKRSVKSILTQTHEQIEFLICDDGSTPAACGYLDLLVQQDDRVRLIRKEGCFDLASKLNLCLEAVRGEYIARMDDDDFSHPERLEKQLTYLQQHEEIAFVGCNVNLIQGGAQVGVRKLPAFPSVEDFYFTQPYIHPALLFRREALTAVGGYSESRRQVLCEDYDLLLRLYTKGFQGANLQEPLLDYTLPADGRGSRRMGHRLNEVYTRYARFKDLGYLPKAWPWVVKPVAVGLVPGPILRRIKQRRTNGGQ